MENYTKFFLKHFKDKKIMIAGGGGYVGTELVRQLKLNSIKFIAIDKVESNQKGFYKFNLSDKKKIINLVINENPDLFLHLGTHSALAYKNNFLMSFREDLEAIDNIIFALKKHSKAKLVHCSSSYVYSGLKNNNFVNETIPLNPSHNFGLSKLFFEELILRNYPNSISFRLSSVFGKGNYIHPNAIEVMTQEAINKKCVNIWGKGYRKMQYVFLEDVVKNIFCSLMLKNGIYNLCGDNYSSVEETANKIARYFNVEVIKLKDKFEGETLPKMDNKKLKDSIKKNTFSSHDLALKMYLESIEEIKR